MALELFKNDFKNNKSASSLSSSRIIGYIMPIVIGFLAFMFLNIHINDYSNEKKVTKKKVTLFFATPEYEYLVLEQRVILKGKSIKEQIEDIINLLLFGNISYNNSSILSADTKLKTIFLVDKHLHINFSRDFLKVSKIRNKRLIIDSIIATIFKSLSNEVEAISLYVESRPIKTIDGFNSFLYPYERDEFLYRFDILGHTKYYLDYN